jgi:hypothetical protein
MGPIARRDAVNGSPHPSIILGGCHQKSPNRLRYFVAVPFAGLSLRPNETSLVRLVRQYLVGILCST